jgi:MFS family permease
MTSKLGAPPRPSADQLLDLTSLVLAALFGEYSLLIMPFILGAMMEGAHLSEVLAGRLVSLQLLAMAIAAVAVSARLRAGRSVRPLLVAGIAAISVANILCALGVPAPILAVARALTGLGEGAVMAAAAAAVCATSNPHRLFSLIGAAVAIVASLALVAVPWLTTVAGPGSVFWLLALVPLTLLPFLRRIPVLSRSSEAAIGLPPTEIRLSAGMLLVSFLLLWSGASGLWVYAERIGASQGLTPEQIGVCLGIGQLAGIPGPLLAAWGGPRLGAGRSLVAGCVGMAIATVLFVLGGSLWLYALGGSLASFSIMFVVPCFRSRMASLDVSGRTVAASAGFYTVGFGAAPLLVATITTEGQGYAPVAILCCACFLASAALAFGSRPKRTAAAISPSVRSRIAE